MGPPPAIAADAPSPAAPPPQYTRHVVFEIMDAAGNPLPGVKAELSPVWGQLSPSSGLESDVRGRIEVEVQPVLEEPMTGLLVRDRFLLYHTSFHYRLLKDGYVTVENSVEDVQEFNAFADPLFQGIDRRPARTPLNVYVRLLAYTDYLAQGSPAGVLDEGTIKTLIDSLITLGKDKNFEINPGSLALDPEGLLRLGLNFQQLFDPSEMGIQAAGAALLGDTVRNILPVLQGFLTEKPQVKTVEVTVGSGFQFRSKPFALPVNRDFVFRFPAEAVASLLAANPDLPFPLSDIEVTLAGQPLDLKAEVSPEEIEASPGEMLQSPEPPR